jgi:hypothetical protein
MEYFCAAKPQKCDLKLSSQEVAMLERIVIFYQCVLEITAYEKHITMTEKAIYASQIIEENRVTIKDFSGLVFFNC